MIKFYFHPSPNPLKIALYLEETGEPYELIPVDTRKGEQHSDAFKAINPNAKTPAMLDDDVVVTWGPDRIFISTTDGDALAEGKIRRCCEMHVFADMLQVVREAEVTRRFGEDWHTSVEGQIEAIEEAVADGSWVPASA